MDAKSMEPWRELEPFLGCDVPKQEVVLLSHVKAMCVAIAGDYAADLARLTAERDQWQREAQKWAIRFQGYEAELNLATAELERKQRECDGMREALDDLIGAVRHLNPCPATMEKAEAALSAGGSDGDA